MRAYQRDIYEWNQDNHAAKMAALNFRMKTDGSQWVKADHFDHVIDPVEAEYKENSLYNYDESFFVY